MVETHWLFMYYSELLKGGLSIKDRCLLVTLVYPNSIQWSLLGGKNNCFPGSQKSLPFALSCLICKVNLTKIWQSLSEKCSTWLHAAGGRVYFLTCNSCEYFLWHHNVEEMKLWENPITQSGSYSCILLNLLHLIEFDLKKFFSKWDNHIHWLQRSGYH